MPISWIAKRLNTSMQVTVLGKMQVVLHWPLSHSTMKQRLLDWLNFILVADVFLVLLSFAWLAIAVTGHSFGVALGLDLWYKLWEPVFTPAIGILMGGALLSGIISQINKRLLKRE